MALAVASYLLLASEEVAENIVGLVGQVSDARTSHRFLLLESVWRMYESVGSWLGHGLYTFSLLYPAFRQTGDQSTSGRFAHNDYAQIGFEGGLLLLVPLLVIGLLLVVKLLRSLLRKESGSATGYALAGGMAFAQANVNFAFYILPIAIMLGVVLGLAFRDTKGEHMPLGIDVSVGATLFVCILYLVLDVVGYGVISGQRGVPGAEWIQSDSSRLEAFVDLSRRLNPTRGLPHLAAAEISRSRQAEKPERVIALYEKAIAIDPWNPMAFTRYGKYLSERPDADLKRYETLLQQAKALNPQSVDIAIAWISHRRSRDLNVDADVLALAGWCQLLALRGTRELDRLGRFLTGYLSEMPSGEMSAAVAECRFARAHTQGKTRQATWLQRLLMS